MEMRKWVVRNAKGEFLTPRRATGKMYVNRVSWSENFNDAKIFSTISAASNSLSRSGVGIAEVVAVKVELV
jgi:hypothetical protein